MMGRFLLSLSVLLALFSGLNAFTVSTVPSPTRVATRLFEMDRNQFVERGVSVDQDGKSNVWAIEPKVEVEQKSSEEQSTSALFAVGGVTVLGAVAALILTNLPDPNQF